MGNLKLQSHSIYYNNTDKFGNYQFVSLEDIINQFMVVFVGDEKVINKASRTDVAFWAQRALAELSFDTFKSVKAQQIDLPASLTMTLPHDYVNYTQVSWVDAAGIKRPLYPTNNTSNPFQVRQNTDGTYDFPEQQQLVNNRSFDSTADPLTDWTRSFQSGVSIGPSSGNVYGEVNSNTGLLHPYSTYTPGNLYISSEVSNGQLTFSHSPRNGHTSDNINGSAQAIWQKIDVSEIDFVDIEAQAETTDGLAGSTSGSAINNVAGNAVSSTPFWTVEANNYYAADSGTAGAGNLGVTNAGTTIAAAIPPTTIRVGISSTPGSPQTSLSNWSGSNYPSANGTTDIFDVGYVEWTAGEYGLKSKQGLDVSAYTEVYILVTSVAPWESWDYGNNPGGLFVKTTVDDISVKDSNVTSSIQEALGQKGSSTTWEKYNSATPSENNNDDYEDDTYWPNQGERYGLDPSHAQVNGSFYIDNLNGKINFSSNISGKTVILDYISDSLGTDGEMQVHKFAEDAMYKHILCGVMSSRANVGRGQLAYYKKDKFAATRQAKLRLSNIKFKEITQVLRGKSKQIKH
jgi:hypothetical protein